MSTAYAPKFAKPGKHRRLSARTKGLVLLAKAKSKIRDVHRCQFPGCPVRGVGRVESMHEADAGMGGNPDASRGCDSGKFLTGCPDHHRLVHAKLIRFVSTTPAGCDGPVRWEIRASLDDAFRYLATVRAAAPFGVRS